jgi:hypothetical protein
MVTEIGFVSLLVAGFGALAGGLVYLAVRLGRGSRRERHHQRHVLCRLRQRRRYRERGRRRQQIASGNLHQVSPPDCGCAFFVLFAGSF